MSAPVNALPELSDDLPPAQRLLFDEALYQPLFWKQSRKGQRVRVSLRKLLLTDLQCEFPDVDSEHRSDAVNNTLCVLIRKSYAGELKFKDKILPNSAEWLCSIKSYAIRAARGYVFDLLKANRRCGNIESICDLPDPSSATPLELASRNERLASVRDRVLQSPVAKTRRYVAHVVDDWTDEEIGAHSGMTPQAVKQERFRHGKHLSAENADLDQS